VKIVRRLWRLKDSLERVVDFFALFSAKNQPLAPQNSFGGVAPVS